MLNNVVACPTLGLLT